MTRKTLYPPPPLGWDGRAVEDANGARGPDAQSQGLAAWATERGYRLEGAPDLAWFSRWAPFVFLAAPGRIGRVVQAKFGDVRLWLAEAYTSLTPTTAQALSTPVHPHPTIVSFVMAPQLQYRAALRSRAQVDAAFEPKLGAALAVTSRSHSRLREHEKDRFTRRTYGRQGGRPGVADTSFDASYEVVSPSTEEAAQALPARLRSLLLRTSWRGILEVRQRGLIVARFAPPAFEPAALDASIASVGQIFAALTRSAYAVTPRP